MNGAVSTGEQVVPEANSQSAIVSRMASGRITWLGPLALLVGRSTLFIAAQAVVAFIFVLRHHPSPWQAAAPWWSVYGNLADAGCLALLVWFTRKEGLRLRDLIGRVRWRWGLDLFIGIGLLFVIFPFFIVVGKPASLICFGTPVPYLYPGLLAGRTLPLWATIYSLSIYLLIWPATEEMTYQGYALPRVCALCGSRWKAVALVSFVFALQHSFIPLIPDWRYIAWRFLAFWPAMVVMTSIYLRLRRLSPLIVAYLILDISAAMITLKL